MHDHMVRVSVVIGHSHREILEIEDYIHKGCVVIDLVS